MASLLFMVAFILFLNIPQYYCAVENSAESYFESAIKLALKKTYEAEYVGDYYCIDQFSSAQGLVEDAMRQHKQKHYNNVFSLAHEALNFVSNCHENQDLENVIKIAMQLVMIEAGSPMPSQ